tara:strand:+ start:28 stop:435 length:408 start_codon:yes stop_codon:yes gene_type:complete
MAKIEAEINISTDIANYSIANDMEMKKLGSTTGIENSTGVATKKFQALTAVSVIEQDEVTDSKASKVYMRNTGESKADFFHVAINASAAADATTETIGRLYGQDWMLIPYEGAVNITVAPSTAEVMTLEYCIFYE